MRCTACDYAANTEAVRVPRSRRRSRSTGCPPRRWSTRPTRRPSRPSSTTSTRTPEFVSPNGTWAAADTMKNVIVKLRHPDGTFEPLAIGVPGDREVDVKRLEAQVGPAEVVPFDEADFASNPALVKGYIGPGALGLEGTSGIRFLVDPRIVEGTRWVTGANQPGKHVIDLTYGRDFTADGVIEAAEVVARRRVPELRRHARDRPRHRDRPHLPARPQLRRGARPEGDRPGRQARHGDHGVVRRGRLARRRRDRRGQLRRARPLLAARDRPRRRAPRDRRQGGRPTAPPPPRRCAPS